jgi:hypothetical protein
MGYPAVRQGEGGGASMSKARITVTFEYELKPDWYPDGMSPAEMVQLDVANYQGDIGAAFEVMQSYELTFTGEALAASDKEGA